MVGLEIWSVGVWISGVVFTEGDVAPARMTPRYQDTNTGRTELPFAAGHTRITLFRTSSLVLSSTVHMGYG